MTQQLLTAFALGLVGGIIPGPVLTAIFTEVLRSGFYKSLRLIMTVVSVDTFVALFSLSLLTTIGLPFSFYYALSFIGAGVLFWMSIKIWEIKMIDQNNAVTFGTKEMLLIMATNGITWLFWVTVCIPKAITLSTQITYGQYYFVSLVLIGLIISTTGIAFIFSWFRTILSSPRVIPYMFKSFSLLFAYFAIDILYTSAKFFLFQD